MLQRGVTSVNDGRGEKKKKKSNCSPLWLRKGEKSIQYGVTKLRKRS